MTDAGRFKELVQRVRAGDAQAAAELLRTYEAEIRIVARVRLTDSKLRRVLDSVDVCQSVLANFFVRAASGQFDLETPDQLLKLLSTMIRNKITDHARRQQAVRRDVRKTTVDVHDIEVAGDQETPSQLVARDELIDEAHRRLMPDERTIIDRRKQGWDWNRIATDVGGTPEGVRKKMTRAVDRVVRELGLDDAADTPES